MIRLDHPIARRIAGSMVVGCLTLSAVAEAGEPRQQVGITEIVSSSTVEAADDYLADILQDLLVEQIERQLSYSRRAYTRVEIVGFAMPEAAAVDERQEFFSMLESKGFSALLTPEVRFFDQGFALSVGGFRLERDGAIPLASTSELIGANVGFVEINDRVAQLAERLVRELLEGRERPQILLSCIVSADSSTAELATAMRRMALELPFYLSQGARDRELQVDFVGLSAEEYYLDCLDPDDSMLKHLPRIGPEEAPTRDVITGQGEYRGRLVRSDVVDLSFQIRRKEESFATPLGRFALPIRFADRDLVRLATRLLDRLEREVETR